MVEFLVLWTLLLAAVAGLVVRRPGEGGALTLAYFLGLSLIHVPGVLPFLGSDVGLGDEEVTQIGFEITILGMVAFIAGAVLACQSDRGRTPARDAPPSRRAQAFERLGWRTTAVGAIAYFVLIPLSFRVPSLTSVVSAFGSLLILGFWFFLYGANAAVDQRSTLATLAFLPLLPLATLVTGGYLGYGIYWVLSVVAFLFVISGRRIWFYLSAPVAVFLGLSLFVTYTGQRADIRELEWEEQSGLLDRLERVSAIVTEFQLFDLASPSHVTALDDRLNQNSLVGAAVAYHEDGLASFAYGATVPVWALIPRVVWAGKPEVGGGGTVISDFTGIDVAEGTSVGAGQVAEFYVNFGIPGVLIGFLGLGYLLMWLDRGIMRSLAIGDMRGLLLRVMPGMTLLQPGGNLLEILVGCVAAYAGARLAISLRFLDV